MCGVLPSDAWGPCPQALLSHGLSGPARLWRPERRAPEWCGPPVGSWRQAQWQGAAGRGERLPREGASRLPPPSCLPASLTRKPRWGARPPYLALTVSLKLSQLQRDLGVLAAYRNESEVSPAGVAMWDKSRCWGGNCRVTPSEASVGGACPKVPMVRAQSPRAGLSDLGPRPCPRQRHDNFLMV